MRLTPLDLQNHRFPHRLRGYDPGEVDGFVRMVAEDYESLVRENEALHETVRGLEARVAELCSQEGRMRETLVTVQTLTEDLKRTSIREAEMKIAEAEVRAEKILDAAHRRVARIDEQVRELRLVRGRVAAAMRATLESHAALLDGLLAEPDAADPRPQPAAAWTPLPVRSRPEAETATPTPA